MLRDSRHRSHCDSTHDEKMAIQYQSLENVAHALPQCPQAVYEQNYERLHL